MSALEIGIQNTPDTDKNRNGTVNRHVCACAFSQNEVLNKLPNLHSCLAPLVNAGK